MNDTCLQAILCGATCVCVRVRACVCVRENMKRRRRERERLIAYADNKVRDQPALLCSLIRVFLALL